MVYLFVVELAVVGVNDKPVGSVQSSGNRMSPDTLFT